MPLDITTRQEFLTEAHVAAFSVADPGRAPLTVPLWYQYSPGGEPWILISKASRKMRLLDRAGRCTLMVQRVVPTVRYVTVEGPVTRVVPGTRRDLEELSRRYLPAERVDGYMEMADAEHGEPVVVHLRPEHRLSADLG